MKKIFVSSTFRDMNYERDILMQVVFPRLKKIAREYGDYVTFCDLRWGVNTSDLESETGARKVLAVCLDEIDRCKPYMIVILGERYGWIPDSKLIFDAASQKKFTLEEFEKSVTALEIEYGALEKSKQLQRTLFYFRDFQGEIPEDYQAEDEHHKEKLEELKNRIKKIAGARVKYYQVHWNTEENCLSGMDEFANMVLLDIYELLEEEWQQMKELSPYERDFRANWEFVKKEANGLKGREEFLQECLQWLQMESGNLAIKGDEGSGKTALMCKLAALLEAQGNLVLPVFCGNNQLSNDCGGIVKYIGEFLADQLGIKNDSEERMHLNETWKLERLFAEYEKQHRKPLYILIDGVERLLKNSKRERLYFIPEKSVKNIRYIISSANDLKIHYVHANKEIPPLKQEERAAFIQGLLISMGKELEEQVVQKMVQKCGSDSPLYLSLLLQRLTMMNKMDFKEINQQGGGIENINSYQMELIEKASSSTEALSEEILKVASSQIGGAMVETTMELIAVSRFGLREQDLEGAFLQLGMKWNSLDFSGFISYMQDFFHQRNDGRYDFSVKSFRDGILKKCKRKKQLHLTLLSYWDTLELRDEIREQEYTYHCICVDDKVRYVKYLTENYPYGSESAKSTIEMAETDNGKWMTDLLDHCEEYCKDISDYDIMQYFIKGFVIHNLKCEFISYENDSLKRIIWTAAKNFTERKVKAYGSCENYDGLADCLENLVEVYKYSETEKDLEKAAELDFRLLEIQSIWIDNYTSFARPEELATTYASLSNTCILMENPQWIRKMIEMHNGILRKIETYEKDKSFLELSSSSSAKIYGCLGALYEALRDFENLHKALEAYQKQAELCQLFFQKNPKSYIELVKSYQNCGKICARLEEENAVQRAIQWYEKALRVFELYQSEYERMISNRIGVPETINERDLCLILGGLYEKKGERKDLLKAIEVYEKELKIVRSWYGMEYLLIFSYQRLGEVYFKLRDKESLEKSLEKFQKALELCISGSNGDNGRIGRGSMQGSIEQIRCRMGNVYEAMGNADEAKRQYDSGISKRESIVENEGHSERTPELLEKKEKKRFMGKIVSIRKK